MKKYWLMKTEPNTFSIEDLITSPKKTTQWEGIRNYQSRNFMRDEMKVGDEVLLYHSNCKNIGVVGVATVSKNAYPDYFSLDKKSQYFDPKSTKEKNRWCMVDIKFKDKFDNTVLLTELKNEKKLQGMQLLKKGNRLSILPVSKSEFTHILKMKPKTEVKKEKTGKLSVGRKAPLFNLKNQKGKKITLKDYIGKKNIVVYFYPKALTPGCTVQACGISDVKDKLKKLNTVVFGISPDLESKLLNFVEKKELNFNLLSDPDHSIANKYGVWGKKKFMGREYIGINRTSFIIGLDGKIKEIMFPVKTKTHHDDIINFIKTNLE